MLDVPSLLKARIRYMRRPLLAPKYNIMRGDPSRKQIALTFDGHPGGAAIFTPDAAETILEALRTRDIGCSFFLTGQFIVNYPDMTRHMADCGHEIGNHTFSHPHLDSIGKETFREELKKTAEAFHEVTGKEMSPYWRAPYGEYNSTVWRVAANQGLRHVFWTKGRTTDENLDSLDWVDDPAGPRFHTAEQVKEQMLSSPHKNGAIALFHLGARTHDPVYKIIPDLIDGWASQGYRCVTVSELTDR